MTRKFLPFFLIVFLFIFSVNSYAMTEEEFSYYFDLYTDNILSNDNQSFVYTQKIKDLKNSILTKFNNLSNAGEYDAVLFNMSNADNNPPDRFVVFLFKNGFTTFFNQSYNLNATTIDNNHYSLISVIGLSSNTNRIDVDTYTSNKLFYMGNSQTFNFYASNVNCLTNSNSPLPNLSEFINNSITLTAFSGKKFNFTDKNQLQVNLTGDYTIGNFKFYIQHYNSSDDDWSNVTYSNDFYILTGYENPYYITFPIINYLEPGNYRYMATNEIGETVAYSNSFEITSSHIENPATGTINDGNINIDIDTGKTVDNIKDYLGQDPTVTKDQFKDSFPDIDVNDPTSDFFTWLFEQLQSCFSVNTAQYLSFTIFDKTFTVNSDDYIINIPIFNSVIGVGSSIFIFYAIFQDIRREIEKVKEGKFNSIANEDITANMM